MRILVAEEALQSGAGHWPSYIGDLSSCFRSEGDSVDVLTHENATPEVISHVGGTPWYSQNCWEDVRSQGKFGGLLHNWFFYRETLAFIRTQPPYDHILGLTIRMQHLLAFAFMSRSKKIPESSSFTLLFVQGFGSYVGRGVPTIFPRSLSSYIAKIAFRLLTPSVKSGRVTLAGETKAMCDELKRFSGLDTTLFPHPVHLPTGLIEHRSGSYSEITNSDSGRMITVACPGHARHEKGSDLLHDAICEILNQPWGGQFRFVLQWPEAIEMPGGGRMKPDSKLLSSDRVQFVNDNLNSEAYSALLERSDLVILPYRSKSYHQRLSRVAIEAAGKGIPLIYTKQTWTHEIVSLVGSGQPILSESSQAIVEALHLSLTSFEELSEAARGGAIKVREFHCANAFRDLLSPKLERSH